jgi:hypothetical protein
MAIPEMKDAYGRDTTYNGALKTYDTAVTSAENTTAGIFNAGMGWKKVRITASGVVADITEGKIFGGIVTQVTGTSTTITAYDEATADATAAKLIIPTTAALALGDIVGPFGGVADVSAFTNFPCLTYGVEITEGLNVVVGGTGSPTFWVLYR